MIFLLRHLKTYNNNFGCISGQTDSPILNENNIIENSNIMKYIDIIYSSPSKRCLDTLQYIPDLHMEPIIDNRLLERNMGDFEGCPRSALYHQYPDLFLNSNGKIQFRFELTPPNGDSYSDFSKRISSFCEEVMPFNEECNILICSHNQTLKMIYFVLAGIHPSKKDWGKITFPNGKCITYALRCKKG